MLYRYLKVIDLLFQYLHIDITVTSAIPYPYWFSFGIWSISMPFCYSNILIDTFDTFTAILTSLRWLRSFSPTFGPVILWMTPQVASWRSVGRVGSVVTNWMSVGSVASWRSVGRSVGSVAIVTVGRSAQLGFVTVGRPGRSGHSSWGNFHIRRKTGLAFGTARHFNYQLA